MADDGWNSDDDGYSNAAPLPAASNSTYRNDRNGDDRRQQSYGNQQFIKKQTFVKSDWRGRTDYGDSESADKMEVNSSLVGRIIGRGGSKIKELEAESRAKIKIEKSFDNPDVTTLTLIGSPEGQAKARELIEKLVGDRPQQQAAFVNCADSEKYTPHYLRKDNYQEPEEAPIDWNKLYLDSVKLQEEHWATLPPILKDFYQEDPEIAGMSSSDVAKWREVNYNITVERIIDDDSQSVVLPKIPNPVHEFAQAFAGYPEIMEEIRKQNFLKPTPIQGQAWPVLLSGQDLIGIAQTGTGKTLAFLLPALIHIDNQPTPVEEREGPNVLVLAPTRELAIQIEREVNKYQYKGYKAVCIYGGASRRDQIDVVARGVQIVIATPGRLNDLVKAGHLNVEAITYLVLDEADRMLDMGFGPQIKVSLLKIRPTRQTVMTSATWPEGVQRLGRSYMKNPVQVVVGTLDLAAVHTVTQEIVFVNDDMVEKFGILVDFFKQMAPDDKVIVFCGRRATAIQISADIALMGFYYQSIYGGLEQSEREQALEDMRAGTVNILIATDIASRGLDIDNITHIINFDFPHNLEEFVHRVGRTGRAGRTGTAITYISRYDWAKAEGLIDILREAGQEVPDQLIGMAERYKRKMLENPEQRGRGGRGGGGRGGGGRGGGGNRRETKYY